MQLKKEHIPVYVIMNFYNVISADSCLVCKYRYWHYLEVFALFRKKGILAYRHRFDEVAALRALMRAARPLRENGNDMYVSVVKGLCANSFIL